METSRMRNQCKGSTFLVLLIDNCDTQGSDLHCFFCMETAVKCFSFVVFIFVFVSLSANRNEESICEKHSLSAID